MAEKRRQPLLDRSAYEGVASIAIDPSSTRDLEAFLQRVGEASLLLLAMAHLGPYLLVSQPIRRYMLQQMRKPARERFLRCMKQVSMPWAIHQRDAALSVLRTRRQATYASAEGLSWDEGGRLRVIRPNRG